jgi:hypothetical protein
MVLWFVPVLGVLAISFVERVRGGPGPGGGVPARFAGDDRSSWSWERISEDTELLYDHATGIARWDSDGQFPGEVRLVRDDGAVREPGRKLQVGTWHLETKTWGDPGWRRSAVSIRVSSATTDLGLHYDGRYFSWTIAPVDGAGSPFPLPVGKDGVVEATVQASVDVDYGRKPGTITKFAR